MSSGGAFGSGRGRLRCRRRRVPDGSQAEPRQRQRVSAAQFAARAELEADAGEDEEPGKELRSLPEDDTDVAEGHAVDQPEPEDEDQKRLNVGQTPAAAEPQTRENADEKQPPPVDELGERDQHPRTRAAKLPGKR